MRKSFPEKEIKEIVLNSRRLSPKSANYWGLVFKLDKSKILVLTERFRKEAIIWYNRGLKRKNA